MKRVLLIAVMVSAISPAAFAGEPLKVGDIKTVTLRNYDDALFLYQDADMIFALQLDTMDHSGNMYLKVNVIEKGDDGVLNLRVSDGDLHSPSFFKISKIGRLEMCMDFKWLRSKVLDNPNIMQPWNADATETVLMNFITIKRMEDLNKCILSELYVVSMEPNASPYCGTYYSYEGNISYGSNAGKYSSAYTCCDVNAVYYLAFNDKNAPWKKEGYDFSRRAFLVHVKAGGMRAKEPMPVTLRYFELARDGNNGDDAKPATISDGAGTTPQAQRTSDDTKGRSGILTKRPLTQSEVAGIYQNAMAMAPEMAYDEMPSVTAPYKAGMAAASNRNAALTRVNMYRAIAGLMPVYESAELSKNAQYGAVIWSRASQTNPPARKLR